MMLGWFLTLHWILCSLFGCWWQRALRIKPNFSQSLNNLGVVYTVQVRPCTPTCLGSLRTVHSAHGAHSAGTAVHPHLPLPPSFTRESPHLAHLCSVSLFPEHVVIGLRTTARKRIKAMPEADAGRLLGLCCCVAVLLLRSWGPTLRKFGRGMLGKLGVGAGGIGRGVQGKMELALKMIQAAILANPTYAEAYNNLGTPSPLQPCPSLPGLIYGRPTVGLR